jgi:prevent-host-death family protein
MAEAGIRDLRDHLSRYLDRVQAGEELTVTDRGRPVARLVPVDEQRAFERLVADGVVTLPAEPRRSRPQRRIGADGTVSDLVAEQRR